MSWQEKYSMYIFHSYFGQLHSNDTWLSTTQNQYPLFEKVKVLPKLCVSKSMEIYMHLLSIFQPCYFACVCNSHFINSIFPLHIEITLVGNILPHICLFIKPLKTIKLWIEIFLKHHLVIIECDHFYKIVLLIMEMVVWLIHVVWFVWSWLWCWSDCVCCLWG